MTLAQVDEYGGKDIKALKIYYDGTQYKVRHHCRRCKLDLGCYCYDFLEDAVDSCNDVYWECMRHILESVWVDYELAEEIDRVCGTKLVEAAARIDCYESDETLAITNAITEEQAKRILDTVDLSDEFDMCSGELCRV